MELTLRWPRSKCDGRLSVVGVTMSAFGSVGPAIASHTHLPDNATLLSKVASAFTAAHQRAQSIQLQTLAATWNAKLLQQQCWSKYTAHLSNYPWYSAALGACWRLVLRSVNGGEACLLSLIHSFVSLPYDLTRTSAGRMQSDRFARKEKRP